MNAPAALTWLALGWGADAPAPPAAIPPAATFAAMGDDAVQDLVILGETRPILVRLRVSVGDRAFRSAWLDAARTLHAQLDRDHDGKLTTAEAEAAGLPAFLGPMVVAPGAKPREVDVNPKDGVISFEELAEALRAGSGPFRVQVDGLADRRTDALFDHLDRDKDGLLTRPELAAIVGSLRKLDRDDNELIAADEVAGVGPPAPVITSVMMGGRAARETVVPPAVELVAGESPLRVVRLLLKKYDTGSSRGPGKTDSRLSPEEFAIPPSAFQAADTGRDGTLNLEELRKYLAQSPIDVVVDVALSPEPNGRPLARVQGVDGTLPDGFSVQPLAEGVVGVEVGPVRLDIQVDDGLGAAESARKTFRARFDALDANQDGYLEEAELNQNNGQPSPLAGLFRPLDRDGDGKLYPAEVDDYVTRQVAANRGRLTLTASNEGRALFGIIDSDRDRRLGAREVLETFAHVSACDRDRDGKIAPTEIPHHIQLTLTRGDLSAVLASPVVNPNVVVQRVLFIPPPSRVAVGPPWFRKMDRNRDGDVSRREFLGTLDQFDRLDRDHDGLLAPAEAEAATASTNAVKGPGG